MPYRNDDYKQEESNYEPIKYGLHNQFLELTSKFGILISTGFYLIIFKKICFFFFYRDKNVCTGKFKFKRKNTEKTRAKLSAKMFTAVERSSC